MSNQGGFEVNISGFKTKEQAEAFIKAYEGQGEQYADVWFECRKEEGVIDVSSMHVNLAKTYPLKWEGNVVKMVVNPR